MLLCQISPESITATEFRNLELTAEAQFTVENEGQASATAPKKRERKMYSMV